MRWEQEHGLEEFNDQLLIIVIVTIIIVNTYVHNEIYMW